MGQKHSGAVSSVCLYNIMEKHLVSHSSRSDGLLIYLRYHDDILAVAASVASAKRFFEEAKSLAKKCYTIKCEDASTIGVQMLDLFIYKGDRFAKMNRLDYKPFVKPTARHIPLSSSSKHAPRVHKSWPVAEVARMHRLAMHKHDFIDFKLAKIARFELFSLDPAVIRSCHDWVPKIPSAIASQCVKSWSVPRAVRIIFPFDETTYDGFSCIVRSVNRVWKMLLPNILGNVELRIGARNSGTPLATALRRGKL